jgi:hypothetical protein
MKYSIILLILCSSLGFAQSENDQIDSVRTIVVSSGGLYPNKIIEVYTAGSWKRIGSTIPAMGVAGLTNNATAKGLPDVTTPMGRFLRDDISWQVVTTGSSGSLFELDASGNTRPIIGTASDPFYELDAFGNIRPKL